jgi:hypothetical protein
MLLMRRVFSKLCSKALVYIILLDWKTAICARFLQAERPLKIRQSTLDACWSDARARKLTLQRINVSIKVPQM